VSFAFSTSNAATRASSATAVSGDLDGVFVTARNVRPREILSMQRRRFFLFFRRHARQQFRERSRVDLHRLTDARRTDRESEERLMQSLRQEAISVAVPPQDLRPRHRLAHEHEVRTRLRLVAQFVAHHRCEPVERPPHILWLDTDQHTSSRRQHYRASSAATISRNNPASNPWLTRIRVAPISSVRLARSTDDRMLVTSTKVDACSRFRVLDHHWSVRRLSPSVSANVLADTPLARHRRTRSAHSLRVARVMPSALRDLGRSQERGSPDG
jgi:hypothetical protein